MIEINNKKLCESCFKETNNEICSKCGFDKSEYSPDPLVLPMGTKLNDKIIIGRVMGKGGFGVTYLGYDLRMDKIIAVKEYYPNGIAYRAPTGTEVSLADAKSAEAFDKGAEKFYTEAQMVAQFNGNPNIVSVYDYFRANNTVYLIMEFLSGITLKTYVKKHGKLTDGQALFVMDKIAAALSITHSAGVLHRDISPDNIMICMDGKVKLIDFGAARQIMAESSSNLTVVMKPGYTPIEQYTKKGRQGAWTDIYSLGVSIYYALTEIIIDDPYARMESDDELAENSHGINSDFWNILKKCTMINASDRYGSAIDLRKALTSVSAPMKSEPLPLSDDDLKLEDSGAIPENPLEAEKDFPVTSAAAETTEVIEVFEDSTPEPISAPAPEPKPKKPAFKPEPKKHEQKSAAEPVKNKDSEKKSAEKKKLIMGGICAAAVIAILSVGIALAGKAGKSPDDITANSDSVSVTESSAEKTSDTKKKNETTAKPDSNVPGEMNKTVELNDHDMVWGMVKSISKSVLNGFDGDIRVTLKTRYMDTQRNEDGNYYHSIRIMSDGGKNLTVNAVSLTRDEYYNYPVNEDGMDFVFIIPKFFAEHVEDKVYFETENIMVDKAIVEADTYDKEIEFDGEYPGDWQIAKDVIPLNELNVYDGDVRITLDLEVGKLGNGEDLFLGNQPLSYIQPVGDDWFKLEVTADNLKYPRKDEMYMLVGEGKQQFSFTISQDELERFCGDGLKFHIYNLTVKKAYITGVNGSEIKDSASAEADITETTTTVTEPAVTAAAETTTAEAVTTTAPPVTTAKATTTTAPKTTTRVTTTTTTEPEVIEKPLYVPLSTKYPGGGRHDRVNTLHKNYLKYFTGDIKVVLDLEVVYVEKNEEGGYWHSLRVIDGRNDIVNVHAINTGRDYWNNYGIDENQKKFTFIVKRADIDNTYNEFQFDVDNVIVKGATVYDYDPNEYKISPNAKIIQLDSKYQGRGQYSSPIPKKELESFNGDVKVTLSIERFNDEKEDLTVNGEKMYWVGIAPFSGGNKVYTKADNISRWEDHTFELRYVDVPDTFTFVISKSEISKLEDEGLKFDCRNVIIKSAALEKA